MNRYKLLHITDFQYDGPVSESYNEVRLRPMQDDVQSCLSFRITTIPPSQPSAHLDFFGNWVHQFNVLPDHRLLRIETESIVLVHKAPPPDGQGISLDELGDHADQLCDDFYDLITPTEYVPQPASLSPLIEAAQTACDGTALSFVEKATEYIHTNFRYEKGATQVKSTIIDALSTGAGVCQDFAHLFIAVMRKRGIPARYVSGYLVPRRTAEPGASVEEVIGGQASHAWAEAYVPGIGWVGQDPTLGRPVGLQHIRIAYGRDYGDVAPVRGVYKGHAGQRLSVDVRVRPALDDEGCEHLQETAAGPVIDLAELEPPQQQHSNSNNLLLPEDRPLTEVARVDYVQLFAHETVAQSVVRVREATAGERIAYFYVTDREDHLLGVVPARRLLVALPDTSIAQIMIGPVITVPETGTLRDALAILASRRLMAVPLVDDQNHLNGVIDLEHYTQDAIDASRRESAETLFQILGVHTERERAGVWSQFSGRFPWLLFNIASGLIAAAITGAFQHTLQRMVALAFFFPVVMGIAESVSMIAVTLGVQHVHHQDHGFLHEFRMGPLLGLAAGALVAAAGLVWIGSPTLALVLCGSVVFGASVGTALGLALPRVVHRWRLDPKIAAGPAVLALTDIATLSGYLILASMTT